MIGESKLIELIGPLDADALQRWIDLGWVLPDQDADSSRFDVRMSPPNVSSASFTTSCGSRKHVCRVVTDGSIVRGSAVFARSCVRGASTARGRAGSHRRARKVQAIG